MTLDSAPKTLGRRLEGGTFYICTGINLDSVARTMKMVLPLGRRA